MSVLPAHICNVEFASSAAIFVAADLVKWRDAVFCVHSFGVCVERDSTLTSGATQVNLIQFVVCVCRVLRSPSDPRFLSV